MKLFFIIAMLFCSLPNIFAQNNVGIGTRTPNANAALEIQSNSKGLLMPRLSTTARKGMLNVPKGIIVFDSSYNSFYYHDGGRWRPISDNNPDSLLLDYSASPQVTANMDINTSTSLLSGLLYDNGSPSGNYKANSNDTYVVTHSAKDDSVIIIGYKVVVESMSTESPHDSLEIYINTKTGFTQKEVFKGNRTGTFFFQNNGDLIFRFKSNNINNLSGFKIRWTKLITNSIATEPPPMYGWYINHKKIATRGGINLNNEWAKDSLGSLSFGYGARNKSKGYAATVFGLDNNAGGDFSFVAGRGNKADKSYAIAIGSLSAATGYNAIAMGDGTLAAGDYSFAAGQYSQALSRHSVALGESTMANDYNAFAMGSYTTASGWNSAAFGGGCTASGASAFAGGNAVIASGNYSTSFGSNAKSIGEYSFAAGDRAEARIVGTVAIGRQAIASGNYAVSLGNNTLASGTSATAVGQNTTAGGASSFASGYFTKANGVYSTAMGNASTASGNFSTALGNNSLASGAGSLAIGTNNITGGTNAMAIGTVLNVAGQYATALGTKITIPANAAGSLGIGDLEFSDNPIDNTFLGFENEFVARFRGGYFFMTSGNAPGGSYSNRTGVKMGTGQNSWSAISDIRLKENFEPVNGEEILHKISEMPLTTWNYKAQDPKKFRHYGPMAQDFFKAFGKDKYGSIGCDTLINQQDFLGVSFVAIQALEKRSTAYHTEIELLKHQLEALKASNELLIKKLEAFKTTK